MESAVEGGGLLASLVHPVGCEFVWGLKNVVQAVSAAQLWNYRWLIEDVTPKPKNILPSQHGYSVSHCRNICNIYLFICLETHSLKYRMCTLHMETISIMSVLRQFKSECADAVKFLSRQFNNMPQISVVSAFSIC